MTRWLVAWLPAYLQADQGWKVKLTLSSFDYGHKIGQHRSQPHCIHDEGCHFQTSSILLVSPKGNKLLLKISIYPYSKFNTQVKQSRLQAEVAGDLNAGMKRNQINEDNEREKLCLVWKLGPDQIWTSESAISILSNLLIDFNFCIIETKIFRRVKVNIPGWTRKRKHFFKV